MRYKPIARSLPDEPFVLAHEELGFDLAHRVQDDADDDNEAAGGDAEGQRLPPQTEAAADDRREDERGHRYEPQEERATPGDPQEHPVDVLLRGAPGAYPGHEAALALQVLRQVLLSEHDEGVEERENDDGDEQERPVTPAARVKHALDPFSGVGDERVVGGSEDAAHVGREDDDGEGEDERDHADGVHPQRDMGLARLPVHTPAAEHAARVLDWDPPLPFLDDDDHVEQPDHERAQEDGAADRIARSGVQLTGGVLG